MLIRQPIENYGISKVRKIERIVLSITNSLTTGLFSFTERFLASFVAYKSFLQSFVTILFRHLYLSKGLNERLLSPPSSSPSSATLPDISGLPLPQCYILLPITCLHPWSSTITLARLQQAHVLAAASSTQDKWVNSAFSSSSTLLPALVALVIVKSSMLSENSTLTYQTDLDHP